MNKDYLKFLKKTKNIYKNINWHNKAVVAKIRMVYLEVKNFNNFSLTLHFFKKHDLLLRMGFKKKDKSYRKNSMTFWTLRGWSEEFAKEQVTLLQSSNNKKSIEKYGCSVSSRKYQKLQGKTDSEIDRIMKNRDRFSFSDLSKEQLKKISKKGSKARIIQIEQLKETNPYLLKQQFNTTKEYYTSKGYSDEESTKLLRDRQNTFTKEKCILKYGEKEGIKIFEVRQKKWQETLNDKSEEEKKLINSKKAVTLENLQRKYGEELGLEKYKTILENRNTYTSKEAINFFERLQNDILIDDEIYWNNNKTNKEYFLYDSEINKFYFYDFTLKNKKIIIEYHGEAFHPRKDNLSESEWKNWKVPFSNQSADEKYAFDQQKKSFAESKGFSVIEVWSSDDYSKSIEKIVKLL